MKCGPVAKGPFKEDEPGDTKQLDPDVGIADAETAGGCPFLLMPTWTEGLHWLFGGSENLPLGRALGLSTSRRDALP
jgi:hypothetical protein